MDTCDREDNDNAMPAKARIDVDIAGNDFDFVATEHSHDQVGGQVPYRGEHGGDNRQSFARVAFLAGRAR